MIYYIEHTPEGRIIRSGEVSVSSISDIMIFRPENQLIEVPKAASPSCDYWNGTEVAPQGEPPSMAHCFNYATKQWEDPRTAATEWVLVRARRDALLSDTDWVVTKAVEAGSPVPENWKTYRQALRDITVQADPFNLVWPTSPS